MESLVSICMPSCVFGGCFRFSDSVFCSECIGILMGHVKGEREALCDCVLFYLCTEHLLWFKEHIVPVSRAVTHLTFQERRSVMVLACSLFIHQELWRWHLATPHSTCWSRTSNCSENTSGTDLFFTRWVPIYLRALSKHFFPSNFQAEFVLLTILFI